MKAEQLGMKKGVSDKDIAKQAAIAMEAKAKLKTTDEKRESKARLVMVKDDHGKTHQVRAIMALGNSWCGVHTRTQGCSTHSCSRSPPTGAAQQHVQPGAGRAVRSRPRSQTVNTGSTLAADGGQGLPALGGVSGVLGEGGLLARGVWCQEVHLPPMQVRHSETLITARGLIKRIEGRA